MLLSKLLGLTLILTTALPVFANIDSYRGRLRGVEERLDRINQRIIDIENGLNDRKDRFGGFQTLDRRFQAIQGTIYKTVCILNCIN